MYIVCEISITHNYTHSISYIKLMDKYLIFSDNFSDYGSIHSQHTMSTDDVNHQRHLTRLTDDAVDLETTNSLCRNLSQTAGYDLGTEGPVRECQHHLSLNPNAHNHFDHDCINLLSSTNSFFTETEI